MTEEITWEKVCNVCTLVRALYFGIPVKVRDLDYAMGVDGTIGTYHRLTKISFEKGREAVEEEIESVLPMTLPEIFSLTDSLSQDQITELAANIALNILKRKENERRSR